jgi:uncharacterized protein YpuA (DUF1002 family)
MAREKSNDLLKQINNMGKRNWSMDEIKSIAKGYSQKDLKNEKKLDELIKKVSKAVGVQLSDKQLSSVKKQVHDRLG